jgi:hypothetical protein
MFDWFEEPAVAKSFTSQQRFRDIYGAMALEGQLHVRPEDSTHAAAPDEVTADEHQRAARLYGNLALGYDNLILDDRRLDDKDEGRARMLADVRTILTTRQGRGVLQDLADRNSNPILLSGTDEGWAHTDFTRYGSGGEQTLIDWHAGADQSDGLTRHTGASMLFHELVHAYLLHSDEALPGSMKVGRDVPAVHPFDVGLRADEYMAVFGPRYSENAFRDELDSVFFDDQLGTRARYNACDGSICDE